MSSFRTESTGKPRGNARRAVQLAARSRQGGAFVLRIEDTDVERSTAESGQDHRGHPVAGARLGRGADTGGAYRPYRQSERAALYATYATQLLEQDRAYCFCSANSSSPSARRRWRPAAPRTAAPLRQQARHQAGETPAITSHPGQSKSSSSMRSAASRFHTDVIGDPIIVRAEGTPAYNFAVVIDDALMGITQVIRGEDHISNTPRQILLYEALGFTRERRIGKHRWVVTAVVEAAGG
jgi:nondiscriminating glutamyl-tRNA synthetase